MPTVLYVRGWRLFFYANEGTEPIHYIVKRRVRNVSFG